MSDIPRPSPQVARESHAAVSRHDRPAAKMMHYFSNNVGTLYNTDCRDWLRDQGEGAFDACVTSPPYWILRDYGTPGQLGQEATPQDYIENLRLIFRDVYRVLHRRGSLWLNLGDNYYGGPPRSQPKDTRGLVREATVEKACERCGSPFCGRNTRRFCSSKCGGSLNRKRTGFERPKCLLGLPWRVASALIEEGWVLRNAVVWHKPNARPSPCVDRLTLTYEMLFHLVKQGDYVGGRRYDGAYRYELAEIQVPAKGGGRKNVGDVWSVNTTPNDSSNYAVFPPALIERPIRATVPLGGTVFDPFMGSGTVAVVAEGAGRRWIGTEINRQYCDEIVERMTSREEVYRDEGGSAARPRPRHPIP